MSARARGTRTLAQKLGAIVLGFEAIVVILAGLTIYGLRALPDGIPQWWAIAGGALVAVAMVAVAGAIARPWAVPAGWALQAVVLAGAFLEPAIAFVALIFGGMWAYATIVGARIDRRGPAGTTPDTQTESE
ncbi:DUF4233 domain-containing protein [Microbacterium sp.]|uniref:DUF4233 domain-containing protein n=1 Tax=Microbacterium sp. TaxID=51671 RepID=UPI002810E9CF|nr:DUF4233 domain-containing protein [Microbacterium sp.]